MEKLKQIVDITTIDQALEEFGNQSIENRDILRVVEKIGDLINGVIIERTKKGYSQRDLAKIVGIKQPMLARFERGEIMPRLDTFLKIAVALDLDLNLVKISHKSNIVNKNTSKAKKAVVY